MQPSARQSVFNTRNNIMGILLVILAGLLWLALSTSVLAQGEEVPSPYAGLKNPFKWDDTQAQAAGEKTYRQLCLGCHGVKGEGIPTSDFSKQTVHQRLEESADYYFWRLSEGRMDRGMPGYKASLSDEARWQTLTYMWTLTTGSEKPPEVKPDVEGASLNISTPENATAGDSLVFRAVLRDSSGLPVAGADIEFLINVDFLTGGMMKIGVATTNKEGVAELEFVPRFDGMVEVIARYQSTEASSQLTLEPSSEAFYTTHIGISFPGYKEGLFVGPKSATELGEQGVAPSSALRIPGYYLNGLIIVAIVLALIWVTYARVFYQIFRIPVVSELDEINLKLVPTLGLAFVIGVGSLLLLMLLTGPYSYWHIPH